jgi:glycosyltransferase involved in cell wall biosynthesis
MNKKKILIISQYFWPEDFKGNDIAVELVKKGHEVTVLTAKPNYPSGKFYNNYTFLNKRQEIWYGVKIVRCPIIPRGNNNIMLLLNYFSFIFFASFAVLFRIKRNYDVVFVQQLSPIFIALPGILYKRINKKPLILWVLDLWPESIRATLGIKKGFLYSIIINIVKFIYKNSDKILISSKGFEISIKNYLHEKKRLIYFPNWAEDVFVQKKQIKVPEMPSGYNIMFAGNVGEAQDFETILNAAKETKQNNINWIIIGDGRKKKWVEEEIVKRNITNVYLFGRYPMEYMPSFFEKADAMLVSLKKDEIFGLTVPAKIQTYLCSGKVIIGMLDGEGAEIIKESKAGLVCNSGDTECLIKNAILLSTLSLSSIKNMEKNAIKYYNNNFDKETLLRQLEQIIISSK